MAADSDADAQSLISSIGLVPYPSPDACQGYFKETWVSSTSDPSGRPSATGILYLLSKGDRSNWHRVDADEFWIFNSGAPLRLWHAKDDSSRSEEVILGMNVGEGEKKMQYLIPKGEWQAAESSGDWTLVSCIVAPGFKLEGFEVAPKGWSPGR